MWYYAPRAVYVRLLLPQLQVFSCLIIQIVHSSLMSRPIYTTCVATVPTGRSTNSMTPSTMFLRAGSDATLLPAR